MLSILLYGRNDAYGGTAQRRSALSINALAAVLEDDDEIIFVDYNTDNHKLTFAEMIADTLTPRAQSLVRVVRVRPEQHALLSLSYAPPVVESIARNIGLRHTNPANRWVLSTNPDIILLPPAQGLRDLLGGLEDGYYAAPRFELPRLLWQRLPRSDPAAVHAAIAQYAAPLHLAEEVRHYLPAIGFDAPGDFQLVLRSDLMEIGGFDEAMQRAWHVDANLMARLALKYAAPGSLAGHLRIYHCEHTADTAAKHSGGRAEDSFDDFVTNVSTLAANSGRKWGGEGLDFEVTALAEAGRLEVAQALADTIGQPQAATFKSVYGPESFGRVARLDAHTLTFITDRLFPLSRASRMLWLGFDAALRMQVQAVLDRLGFVHPLLAPEEADAFDAADLVLLDSSAPDAPLGAVAELEHHLDALIEAEMARVDCGQMPRQIIAINAIHCQLEEVLMAISDVVLCPFTTRLRPAVLRPGAFGTGSWLADMAIGGAGERVHESEAIRLRPGPAGHVFYGPYRRLRAGRYSAAMDLNVPPGDHGRLVLEVVQGETFLAQIDCVPIGGPSQTHQIEFVVAGNACLAGSETIQIRLWSDGRGAGIITVLEVQRERP